MRFLWARAVRLRRTRPARCAIGREADTRRFFFRGFTGDRWMKLENGFRSGCNVHLCIKCAIQCVKISYIIKKAICVGLNWKFLKNVAIIDQRFDFL